MQWIRAWHISAKYMSKIIIIKWMWEAKGERRVKNITSDWTYITEESVGYIKRNRFQAQMNTFSIKNTEFEGVEIYI